MRMGNFHQPPTRVNDTRIPIQGQAEALQCKGDAITHLPNADDNRVNSDRAKKNFEDDNTDEWKSHRR